mmetsp:Transcript_71241/g.189433  ORF Transcript_71241/g.189433 Transcript_71241/m.189433 type:complete len:233 (-) Transcript_71241:1460-2158(-)
MPDDLQRALTEPEVLRVGEGHRRGDDNGVTRVDAHRVKVLHVAHRDAVVVGVAHHLVLELLPALQALVNNDLRAVDQGSLHQCTKLGFVVRETAAQATQGEGSPHQHWVADALGGIRSFIDCHAARALCHLVPAIIHCLRKELAVLGREDCLDRCAQNGHVVLVKDALLLQLDCAIQSGLSAKCAEDAIGPLTGDDLCHELRIHWQEVDAVCIARGGLDGGYVRVDEDRLHA